jgi:hypothetical protein
LPVPAHGSAISAGALSPAARLFRAGFSENRETANRIDQSQRRSQPVIAMKPEKSTYR